MKTSGFIGVAVALVVLVALTGSAMADRPANAVPETQGVSITQVVNCVGTVMESESLTWVQTGGNQTYANWDHLAGTNDTQYTTGYSDTFIAPDGQTNLVKTSALDTANKVLNQNNFKVSTQIQYVSAGNGARATRDESLMLDGVGDTGTISGAMLCPFASVMNGNVFPSFCNVQIAGSKFDMTQANVVTNANERFLGSADYPVTFHYDVKTANFQDSTGAAIPNLGSISSYYRAHFQEGRMNATGRAMDLSYASSLSASGVINAYSAAYDQQSGIRRI
jgi:hypothetical protein